MLQVRIHGRGGQGVVTAAELLASAAFVEGRYAQAFPSFGSERTGAPVVAFCRIDSKPIRTREPIVNPDALIVQDVTLVHQVDLFAGLGDDGFVIVNTSRSFAELGLEDLTRRFRADRLVTLPATELALEHIGRPLPNAVLLAGFAELSGAVSVDSVVTAIGQRFSPSVAAANVAAARAAAALVARRSATAADGSTSGKEAVGAQAN